MNSPSEETIGALMLIGIVLLFLQMWFLSGAVLGLALMLIIERRLK